MIVLSFLSFQGCFMLSIQNINIQSINGQLTVS